MYHGSSAGSVGIPTALPIYANTTRAWGSPPAFHLTPGTHRRKRWTRTRRGHGGETTGGAIVLGARPEETMERGALSLLVRRMAEGLDASAAGRVFCFRQVAMNLIYGQVKNATGCAS